MSVSMLKCEKPKLYGFTWFIFDNTHSLLYESFTHSRLPFNNNINPVKQMLFYISLQCGEKQVSVSVSLCLVSFYLWPKIECKIRNYPKELVTFDWKNIFSLNYSLPACVLCNTDKLIVKPLRNNDFVLCLCMLNAIQKFLIVWSVFKMVMSERDEFFCLFVMYSTAKNESTERLCKQ